MKIPSEAPRLPALPFVVADIVLLLVAALIGWQAPAPLGVAPLAAISACVGLAAIAGLLPLIFNFNRAQEEALQDRANQIEALARTVSATADQVSIAAANLPSTAATIAQQLEAAKALPTVLQSQLKDAHAQLASTAAAENTALREEVATLRRELAATRENDTARLSSALAGITRATAELASFEALAKQHAEALARLPAQAAEATRLTTEALEKATAAAIARIEAAAAQSRSSLETASAAASASLNASLDHAAAHNLATLSASLSATADHARATLTAALDAAIASATTTLASIPVQTDATFATASATPAPTAPDSLPAPVLPSVETLPATGLPSTDTPVSQSSADSVVEDSPVVAAPDPAPAPEPAPVTAEPETAPEPEPELAIEAPAAAPSAPPADEPEAEDTETEATASPDSESSPSAPAEPALSSDGLTRLIATAYIGIGNKLFIRGDGPGLSLTKGTPLQFVSIGKWRWENPELLFPARVRLYKNDQIECTALGEFTLEPGHHHEVNASF